MHFVHKFVSPTATAMSVDSLGGNLPFELGPWKASGTAVLIDGHDAMIMREVFDRGFRLAPRLRPEESQI
jgi:hypothetical protein